MVLTILNKTSNFSCFDYGIFSNNFFFFSENVTTIDVSLVPFALYLKCMLCMYLDPEEVPSSSILLLAEEPPL